MHQVVFTRKLLELDLLNPNGTFRKTQNHELEFFKKAQTTSSSDTYRTLMELVENRPKSTASPQKPLHFTHI